jgi:hypothetical protein
VTVRSFDPDERREWLHATKAAATADDYCKERG